MLALDVSANVVLCKCNQLPLNFHQRNRSNLLSFHSLPDGCLVLPWVILLMMNMELGEVMMLSSEFLRNWVMQLQLVGSQVVSLSDSLSLFLFLSSVMLCQCECECVYISPFRQFASSSSAWHFLWYNCWFPLS